MRNWRFWVYGVGAVINVLTAAIAENPAHRFLAAVLVMELAFFAGVLMVVDAEGEEDEAA